MKKKPTTTHHTNAQTYMTGIILLSMQILEPGSKNLTIRMRKN
jgi:hypothetical protein